MRSGWNCACEECRVRAGIEVDTPWNHPAWHDTHPAFPINPALSGAGSSVGSRTLLAAHTEE
jgi:hypothetical protein